MWKPAVFVLACAFTTPALAQQAEVDARGGDGAIGKIPCTSGGTVPMQQCPAGISGNTDGTISVRVILPGGNDRILTFRDGTLEATNSASTASVGTSGDWVIVSMPAGERIEIPKAALSGR